MKKLIFIIAIAILRAQTTNLVLSEVMFNTSESNTEFIEVFNSSETESIDISNIKIIYQTSKTDKLILPQNYLPPKTFLIIMEKDYDFESGIYKNLLPNNAIIATTADNAFGRSGMSNSSNRTIYLLSKNDTIDICQYTANNDKNHSEERITLNPYAESWKNSLVNYGTPGFKNSVSPVEFDLAVDSIYTNPANPIINDDVEYFALIKNTGEKKCGATLFRQQENFYFKQSDYFEIEPNDSLELKLEYKTLNITNNDCFILVLKSDQDENPKNDTLKFCTEPGYPPKSILISEVMFYPDNGEPEWIEFFNKSKYTIDLKDWSIFDQLTTPRNSIIVDSSSLIYPEKYFVVARSNDIKLFHTEIPSKIFYSQIPNLNNNEDGVIIKDHQYVKIDSLFYKNNISKGYSIERISFEEKTNTSSNWQQSYDIEQSTPGRPNSVKPLFFDIKITGLIVSPEFPTYNEYFNVKINVENALPDYLNSFQLKIYLNQQNLVDTLINEIETKKHFNIELSSKVKLNSPAKISATIFSSQDSDTSNNYLSRWIYPQYPPKSLLINEILYKADPDQSECVEIINVADYEINLSNWEMGDITNAKLEKITNSELIISPEDFLVFSNDSESQLNYCIDKEIKFGSLGNSEDGFIIKDASGKIIDSVYYSNSDCTKGFSIERISYNKNSLDSTNWDQSIDPEKHTLGKLNSQIEKTKINKADFLINEILFNPIDNNSEFVEFYNNSNKTLNLAGAFLQVGDRKYRINFNFIIHPENYFVLAADSIIFQYYNNLNSYNTYIFNSNNLNLTNSRKLVCLIDPFNNLVDSLSYSEEFHNPNLEEQKNISIERISFNVSSSAKNNWSSSLNINGATPALKNSIYTKSVPQNNLVSISPNPFSPNNDGYEDNSLITLNLNSPVNRINIKIFDIKGRKVRELATNKSVASGSSLIFDGKNSNGIVLETGIYILLIESIGSNGEKNSFKETIVVVKN